MPTDARETDQPMITPAAVRQHKAAARLSSQTRLLSLDDFEKLARRRLPNMIFGYVDGAVETRSGMHDNASSFAEYSLVPRQLVDVSGRDTSRALFGHRFDAPFGVAPLGGTALVAYDGDRVLARAARDANVPFILSASSLTRLEDIQRINPDAWFQTYIAGDPDRIRPMIDRVARAGFTTLVVTADTPVAGNRENNLRSGFSMPMRVTPRTMIDSALHPRWLLGTIVRTFATQGVPHFENMDAVRGPPMMSQKFVRNMNNRDRLTWQHVEAIRDHWKGRLVIKGLLSVDDVIRAREMGVDGVIVSNHGGRQLDYSVAPLRVLADIVAESGDMTIMIDGGIRRGTDVVKALALGAAFVFVGRPFLYSAAVGGARGVTHAFALLREEIHRDMALLGTNRLEELTAEILCRR